MIPDPELSAVDDYFEARNNKDWQDLSESERKAAILDAAQYIDAFYIFRSDIDWDDETVKQRITAAVSELAVMYCQGDLYDSGGNETKQGPVTEERVEGVVTVTYADVSNLTDAGGLNGPSRLSLVDALLADLTTGKRGSGSKVAKLVRT